jgi:hypothetical protein
MGIADLVGSQKRPSFGLKLSRSELKIMALAELKLLHQLDQNQTNLSKIKIEKKSGGYQ